MDVLWQRQVDMSTILKTLPAGSWTDTNNIFVRGGYTLCPRRKPYLFLSPCRGTSRGMNGDDSRNIQHG